MFLSYKDDFEEKKKVSFVYFLLLCISPHPWMHSSILTTERCSSVYVGPLEHQSSPADT